MKKRLKKKAIKKLLLFFLLILLIIMLVLIFTKQNFRVKNLENEILEVNTNYKLSKLKVCYGSLFLCEKANYKITNNNINIKKIGDYKVHYKLTYKNKTKKVIQEIKVVDTTKPKIKIANKEIMVCPNKKKLNTKIIATDNYDKNINKKIGIKFSSNKVVIRAKDSSGNETIIIRKASIEDKNRPKIILKGDKTEYVQIGKKYEEKGVKAIDICDGNITKKVISKNNIDTSKLGTYQVVYEVTDSSNNKAKAIRNIKIIKKRQIIIPKGKTIYLTFDDGPGEYTDKLLDILKKYNVKATFFVTNNIKNYKEVVKRASDEGHTIGLHTWSHKYSIYKSKEAYFHDLYKLKKEVEQITGKKENIIRFPGGSSNTISYNYKKGIMKYLTKEVENRGFYYFDWNIESNDSGGTTNTKKITKNIITHLKGPTNVVLQHDIYNYSIKSVEQTIKYGLKHGYKFSRIKETTPGVHHMVNN